MTSSPCATSKWREGDLLWSSTCRSPKAGAREKALKDVLRTRVALMVTTGVVVLARPANERVGRRHGVFACGSKHRAAHERAAHRAEHDMPSLDTQAVRSHHGSRRGDHCATRYRRRPLCPRDPTTSGEGPDGASARAASPRNCPPSPASDLHPPLGRCAARAHPTVIRPPLPVPRLPRNTRRLSRPAACLGTAQLQRTAQPA